jgi:hypothetical protein
MGLASMESAALSLSASPKGSIQLGSGRRTDWRQAEAR